MSFNNLHTVKKTIGTETFDLRVYVDKSASFTIIEDGAITCSRLIDEDEDGSDIAIGGEARTWFERELATGRAGP